MHQGPRAMAEIKEIERKMHGPCLPECSTKQTDSICMKMNTNILLLTKTTFMYIDIACLVIGAAK